MFPIPRSDICMSDPMPFCQHWEARVPVPLEQVGDLGLALHAAYSSFRPGDKIEVCAFDKNDWKHLTEVVTVRIVSLDDSRIKVVQVGDVVKVPKPKKTAAVPAGEKLTVVPVQGAFEVQDSKGNTLETFVERKQADAFARREGGEDKPKAGNKAKAA